MCAGAERCSCGSSIISLCLGEITQPFSDHTHRPSLWRSDLLVSFLTWPSQTQTVCVCVCVRERERVFVYCLVGYKLATASEAIK